MINAGTLIHLVEIQNRTGSTSPGTRGQTSKEFATVECVYASINDLSAQETIIAKQIDARATHKIQMYYTASLNVRSQIKFGSRTFNVLMDNNVEQRNIEWDLTCMELK